MILPNVCSVVLCHLVRNLHIEQHDFSINPELSWISRKSLLLAKLLRLSTEI